MKAQSLRENEKWNKRGIFTSIKLKRYFKML
jgi:hypothetical protein